MTTKKVRKRNKKQVRKILKEDKKNSKVTLQLPDPSSYPRAIAPKTMPEPRFCKHCERWNPKCWTDPEICVFCSHKLSGEELKKEG